MRVDIGNQLKNTRVFLGLTQEEFCAGIVTESFYSRVENNKSRISMDALLKILNYHHVSLYNFFVGVDTQQMYKGMMQAFIDRNIAKLHNYQNLLAPNKKYQLEFTLMFAILNDKVASLPDKVVQQARSQLLQIGKLSEEALFNVNLLVPVIDFKSLQVLVDYLVGTAEINYMNLFSLQLLCHGLLAYLKRCYQEKNRQEAEKVLNFFAGIQNIPSLFLENLLANGYHYLFEKDKKKLSEIIKVLQSSGYTDFAIDLERLEK